MDIFIGNVPEQLSDTQVENFFRRYINDVGCRAFHVRKLKNKSTAFITIPDAKAAQEFLTRHNGKWASRLTLGANILVCKEAQRKPDQLLLNALSKEEKEIRQGPKSKTVSNSVSSNLNATFPFETLYCGLWEYQNERFVFHKYYEDVRCGSFTLGRGSLSLRLESIANNPLHIMFDIFFSEVTTIAIGDFKDPHVTFTLRDPPKFARRNISLEEASILSIRDLSIYESSQRRDKDPDFTRVSSLHPNHDLVAACCRVYKVILRDIDQLREVQRTLAHTPGSPTSIPRWVAPVANPPLRFREQIRRMEQELQAKNHAAAKDSIAFTMPWPLQFQFMRLAYNCILSPIKIRKIISPVQNLLSKYSIEAVVHGVRKLAMGLDRPGPEIDPGKYSAKRLVRFIERAADEFSFPGSAYDTASRHEHLGMICRVTVTPTGMVLEGPELETKNRVLRQYSEHIDYFIRVTFSDEDFEPIRWNRNVSPTEIYQKRFRSVLTTGINLCGRVFRFLGFSNSSLHSHQCWFMAPFVQPNGTLKHAPMVIQGLGDFREFRSPAKCAARIGQTFSDATDSITIDQSWKSELPDIERLDRHGVKRTFSDGVGTISKKLLMEVWNEFRKAKKEHATILQIRFQGAKGMVALDTRLIGKQLNLRPSMIKFTGSPSKELEICGAGYRYLPMNLNRQFIKILEDLGVPPEAFLELQREAVMEIREVMLSPINAARFLEVNFVTVSAQIPALIRSLWTLGYNFRDDKFLSYVVEMTAFNRLREIKYRGRIPVKNGYTLYGVVDETGILEPNEIYAAIRYGNGSREVLTGQLLITRAPALHPGDVQLVRAVLVPEDSPLRNLHNCVVFSQKGDRDLPSMLSGGDLDGDIFQLVFERSLWPRGTFTAADYKKPAPVDIERAVVESDITDFFLTYMETDHLGRIANTHLIVADQKEGGTLSPECLTLAELHSTAVDFAKTGIAVDLYKFPKTYNKKLKPDFMATAPRMLIGVEQLTFQEADDLDGGEDNPFEDLGIDLMKPPRFYQSAKVLGQLYRDIDEGQIHAELQNTRPSSELSSSPDALMVRVYHYVISQTMHVDWEHCRKEAREIRSRYEETLVETAFQYSCDQHTPLAELEVFTGFILGRNIGMLSKRNRARNIDMKEKFDRDVAFIISWIVHGDRTAQEPTEQEDNMEGAGPTLASEGLARSIACFAVAMEEEGETFPKFGSPQSFRYVAAGVCLKEIQKRKVHFGVFELLARS